MSTENNELSFNNQQIYIGLDIHKKSWQVTLRSGRMFLKTFRMDPKPQELLQYVEKNYPGGDYYSAYEAGFSGYWVHRELESGGIKSIVVSPASIATTGREKVRKSDVIDSAKIARELEGGEMEGIYIPSEYQQEFRSLVRLREQLVRSNARTKNQIKSYLNFSGCKVPENYQTRNWSGAFIAQIRGIKFKHGIGDRHLEIQLEELTERKKRIATLLKEIRRYVQQDERMREDIRVLMTVPGFGFITSVTMVSEIMDINRFQKFDQLAAYVGLAPAVYSSGEKEKVLGMMNYHNSYLRNLMIEAAWIVVREDPAMTQCFNEYQRRMCKQKAIIKIAKKLLRRMRAIWKKQSEYAMGVIN